MWIVRLSSIKVLGCRSELSAFDLKARGRRQLVRMRWRKKEEGRRHTCAALGVISIFIHSPSSSRLGLYMHLVPFKVADALKLRTEDGFELW